MRRREPPPSSARTWTAHDSSAAEVHQRGQVELAAAKGRPRAAPTKIFISGISMGGHITAAAIEAEAARTAVNKVKYAGAVPMCGVVGDTELFNCFAGYQVVAQQLAGFPMSSFPTTDFATLAPVIRSTLWTTF